jgi:hypothetical protein
VPRDHVARRRAQGPRRGHEVALLERERFPSRDPRIGHPAARAQHEDHVEQARAEDGDDHHAQEKHREGELDVA